MKPKWHKLPPVPGWYAVTLLHKGEVEAMGTGKFSEWKISETEDAARKSVEEKNG